MVDNRRKSSLFSMGRMLYYLPGRKREARKHSVLGDRARDRHGWLEAAEHYRRALLVRPTSTGIRVQLANMLKEAGHYGEAEANYSHALLEQSDNADIYLQLGHLYKLQWRQGEAREAYLTALRLDPDMISARNELRDLGVSRRSIDQHIAASQPRGCAPNSDQPATVVIAQVAPPLMRCIITDVARDHVAGEILDISRSDLPIVIVCRTGGKEVATCCIDVEGNGAGSAVIAVSPESLPRSVAFRLALEGVAPGAILHLRCEPDGEAFIGSPFLLPCDAGASLVARIERLEALVGYTGPDPDMLMELERRLASSVTAMAADRLNGLLRYQRETFEKELLALEARLAAVTSAKAGEYREPAEAPTRCRLDAADTFPGLGWGPPVDSGRGAVARALGARSLLSIRIANPAGLLLQIDAVGDIAADVVQRLVISAGGERVPFWVESGAPDAVGYRFGALISARASSPDGVVTIKFEIMGMVGLQSGEHDRIAVAAIDVSTMPLLDQQSIRDGVEGCLVQGWVVEKQNASMRGMSAQILFPAVQRIGSSTIVLNILGDAAPHDILLNGHAIVPEVRPAGRVVLSVLDGLLRSDQPNLLLIHRNDEGAFTLASAQLYSGAV